MDALYANVCFFEGEAEGNILCHYENGNGTLYFVLATYGLTVPTRPPGADKHIRLCLSLDNVILECEFAKGIMRMMYCPIMMKRGIL